MITEWLRSLAFALDDNVWLAPLIAFAAGLLTALTPCSLSSLPLAIGYLGGAGNGDRRRTFGLSATMALGMSITFTALGVAVALIGRALIPIGKWWFIILGVFCILMALQVWEIFNFIPSTYLQSKNTRRGYLGALFTGMLGGLFASPCTTPVLAVLLAFVARRGSIARGALLLFLYALGNSVLVLCAGMSIGWVRRITSDKNYGKWATALKIVTGALVLLLGLYMLYLGF